MPGLTRRTPAWVLTAVCGLAYVIVAPPSTDLAAASYRSYLFSQHGFTLWDNSWYGGHPLPAYSILAPALGAWIGPQLVAALSMVAATALFALFVDGLFPARATRIAALFFAVGASVSLLSNRVPFDLGLALGLASLLAVRRSRPRLGTALAILCSLASPVSGAFLGLAYLAWLLAGLLGRSAHGRRAWAWPLALIIAALAPIALLTLVFPEGGTQPFAASAFYPDLLGVLVIVVLIARIPSAHSAPGPRDGQSSGGQSSGGDADAERSQAIMRVLLIGALLYAVALVGAYVLPTAVGGNADRLGALFAGPVVACFLTCRPPRWLLALLAPFLLYWQVNTPISDRIAAASDPAIDASYYTPLLRELQTLDVGYSARPARIEVVATTDHWEARWLAPHIPLARGWERQLDQEHNALFYDSTPLTPAIYHAWLQENAISYVALPDAPLDYSAITEARLLRGGSAGRPPGGTGGSEPGSGRPPAYLHEIWRSSHWRLYAVLDPAPMVTPPARMTALTTDSFMVGVPRAGSYIVRIRFTSYWGLSSGQGCVSEAPGGWTELHATRAETLHVTIRFSLGRIIGRGPRCS